MRDVTAPKIEIMLQRLREKTGVPEGIRTPDLRFRKPLLYPAELPGRALHYSRKARRHSRALWLTTFILLHPALALAQNCPGPEQQAGAVTRIHPRLEIEIADGRRIRPAHLAQFESTPRGAMHAARARSALENWTRTTGLVLPQRVPLADRWGRIVTQTFLPSGEDLGLRLVAEGLARVAPTGTDPCLLRLLAAETAARRAKLGLWADSHYAVLAAGQPAALAAHAGEFVIVDGVVQRIGQTPTRFYLEFGPARTGNLSVTFSRQTAKSFADAGLVPEDMAGRLIRIRGMLDMRPHPQIEIYTPAAIEVTEKKL